MVFVVLGATSEKLLALENVRSFSFANGAKNILLYLKE